MVEVDACLSDGAVSSLREHILHCEECAAKIFAKFGRVQPDSGNADFRVQLMQTFHLRQTCHIDSRKHKSSHSGLYGALHGIDAAALEFRHIDMGVGVCHKM